jgi:adenylate kinase
LIAPSTGPDETISTPISAIDLVLTLDISDEEALKRAAGGLLDPITGETYHAEYNPPPNNQSVCNTNLTVF